MIPHAFLQDLLNRVDIVDVVGNYVQLKKGGANFLGLCPFHSEKHPSFTVSATKQFYHCFGCGAHGSAINFMMEHGGLTFPEAVENLAQSVGLAVPREPSQNGQGQGDQGALRQRAERSTGDTMQLACDYYRRQLRGAARPIDYLKQRGLTGEIAARFLIGYAPPDWQNLAAAFDDYRAPALLEAGLVIDSEKTGADGERRRYDRFRDRIMFPIRNARGQVIAFGARIIDSGEPKYLNSPETPLFSKGSELYGLFEARAIIREKGFALVTEGYMDVVALAQLGFGNAVATLGTACTPMHVQKLLRQTDRVVFSFDGDAAGRRAARRALEAALPHAADNREIRFLFLPAEHDPDSFLRSEGAEAFEAEIKRALPLSQFLLNEILAGNEMGTPEGRAKAMFDAKPLLGALPANALRAQIIAALGERTGMSSAEVTQLCGVGEAEQRGGMRRPPPVTARRAVTGAERKALRTLIMFPRVAGHLELTSADDLIRLARHGELFDDVFTHARALGEAAEFRLLSDVLRNGPHAAIYEEIFREILFYDENVRDLMHAGPDGAPDDARRTEAERIALDEVEATVARVRYDAWCARLDELARSPALSTEETAEFMSLSRQTAELKKRLFSADAS
ncbi:MAG: DNA primase [Janthinobacterium lividum]